VSDNYIINNNTDFIVRNVGETVNFAQDNFKGILDSPAILKKVPELKNINTKLTGAVGDFFGTKAHNIFSQERFDNFTKPKVLLKCMFRNCNPVDHNYNTQYHINFSVAEDKRYNGIWVMELGAIICEFDDEGVFTANYDCQLRKIYE
jgi:hypothetical protein